MTQYIPKSALVAEIKKLHGNPFYRMAIKDVLSILDSLEVKEVDLDKEIDAFFNDWGKDMINGGQYGINLDIRECKDIAKHFFELGVSCQVNNINMEEVKAAAKAWSEDDENTRGCDYIGAVVAERAFVACAEWLINKAQKGEEQ